MLKGECTSTHTHMCVYTSHTSLHERRTGRESKRGASDQEVQFEPSGQETGVSKMVELYRDQDGGRGAEAQP